MTCAELWGMPVRALHAQVQLAFGASEGVSALCSSADRSQEVRQAVHGRHCKAISTNTSSLRAQPVALQRGHTDQADLARGSCFVLGL